MNEIEMRALFQDTAQSLAQVETDPAAWHRWITYLVQSLEILAVDIDPNHPDGIELCLERVRDALTDRMKDGAWQDRK